ncbi:hypothetical protein FOA24_24010 [Bacillus thuringiensis]|uniref:hypothetical protein n=1 Tax=Bacillus thuringiensis TaxID=1428 RepID=UPI003336E4F8
MAYQPGSNLNMRQQVYESNPTYNQQQYHRPRPYPPTCRWVRECRWERQCYPRNDYYNDDYNY